MIKRVVLACFLFSFFTISCQNDNNRMVNMDRLEWKATRCAPKNYPIEILDGYFSYGEEKIFIPKGDSNIGWGSSGPIHVIGDPIKPVPDKLFIQWFSFMENKFYQGEFDLPRQRLIELFSEELDDYLTGDKSRYQKLIVGLAPNGQVVVWISEGSHQVEIGNYSGTHSEELTMKDLNPSGLQDSKAYTDIVLGDLELDPAIIKDIQVNGVEKDLFENYRIKQSWRPILKFTGDRTMDVLSFNSYNGEREMFLQETYSSDNNFIKRAILKELYIRWHDDKEQYYGADIYFDEHEIYQAFNKLNGNGNIELEVKIDKYNSNLLLSISNENETIKIIKSDVKVYETTK